MTGSEDQQMLASLSALSQDMKVLSQDMKVLLDLVRDLTTQQDKADSKAFQQLSQIAHKR